MFPIETLTYDRALSLLNAAIAEKGEDYKYPKNPSVFGGCVYFDPDTRQPSCIIGHVLAHLGVTAEDMEIDSPLPGIGSRNVSTFTALVRAKNIRVDSPRTEALLQVAQEERDQGSSWGDAVAAALIRAARLTTL